MAEVLQAPAKLTVYLHMTGVRGDGYHFIDAEMVSLDLADTLEFSSGTGIEIEGPEAGALSAGPDNLIARALTLAGKDAHVKVTKNIPAGGGLGGGSTNAAAALRWAGVSDPMKAVQIGADVPFCIEGGRARVRGIGEEIEALPYEERIHTLLLPPFGVDTAAVYGTFDDLTTTGNIAAEQRNHLQAAALMVEPRLGEWRDKFREWTGQEPVLAGSGSTWFVDGTFEAPSADALKDARWIVARTTKAIPLN